MIENPITITGSDEGKNLAIAGGQYRILVSGDATEGRYAIIEMNVPPGGGPAPHAHPDIEEIFYVADGTIQFMTKNGPVNADTGAFIRIPLDGGVHAFKNITGKSARLLCTVIPAGLDRMFEEISGADPTQIPAITEKYRQQIYPPDYFDDKN
ncbi:cupin domain-containing protein [Mucilaginibacter sabulilitoris]|uniref:Cupin domain-containing protein n=1 Tax=Mucilaginibacter sabulilitoris TaxID=1173583 RepID=A0ABZ0TYU5_9SPHI|nr:cupin domain-containing protein [Mucilaginibacter sabulilitoris]WPU96265.1 cupin domain-containing protein [Mucilaginibacter sabulilitoris]